MKSVTVCAELRRLCLELREDSARPWVIWTFLPSQLPQQLHLVVAGHAERGPGLDHPHHEPQDARDVGAAIDEIAEEDRLAPLRSARSSCGCRSRARRAATRARSAAVDVADDVERPVIVASVVPERLPPDSPRPRRLRAMTGRRRGGSPLAQAAQRPPQLLGLLPDDVRAEVAVGPRACCARGRASRGRSKTIATGRQWYWRASATSGFRASGWTFVASTTVSLPAASRFAAMKCSTSKASFVAAWLFSSSLTSPRQKSDESTSVALEVPAREGRLAGTRRRRRGRRARAPGSIDPHRANTAICVGEPTVRVLRARRRRSATS